VFPVFAKRLRALVAVSQCFIKATSFINPTNCDVHLVIQFLNTKCSCAAEIRCLLVIACGEGVMNEGIVHKWYCLFGGEGWTVQ
jgi:hypothetical protein